MEKKKRLIELFGGYGSQHFALEYLDIVFEQWKLCEWAVKSIQAYKDAHFSDDTFDYSSSLSAREIVDYLTNKGISANYNEPMTREQIERLGEDKQRQIYNNIKATHNLVNIQQVHGDDLEIVDTDIYDYIMTYSFPCFTADSLVLTKNGYKRIADICIDDEVLSHDNKYHKIVNRFENGIHDIYKINAMGIDEIKTTYNHKFYTREKYRKGHKAIRCFKEPVWKELKDLTNNDYLGIAINQQNRSIVSSKLPTQEKDFWWIIGRYLGDGWIRQQGGIIICCAKDETYEIISKLKNLNWNYNIVNERTVNKIHISKKALSDFVEQFGKGAGNKHLTQDILDLPIFYLKPFIEGYLSADGCFTNGTYKATSISRELIYGIAQCVAKVYKTPYRIYKIIPPKQKIIEGRLVNQNVWYQLVFKTEKKKQDKAFYEDGYIWYPIKSIEYIGKDYVYDIEVEDSHSFTVQNTIVHNCQDLSNAGLGKGMSRGSGTRSGMLWEVERILKELKEENKPLPKYLIMENVPQVHGENSLSDFNEWCEFLKSIGYTNAWDDLNSKNYGIPQNRVRTFMISILDNDGTYFQFPQQIKLAFRLKDLLEKKVDEKYYLSDKVIEKLKPIGVETLDSVSGVDLCDSKSELRDVSNTIRSRYDCGYEHFSPGPTGIIEPKTENNSVNIKGKSYEITQDSENFIAWHQDGFFDIATRAWKDNKIAPTMHTDCGNIMILDSSTDKDTYLGTYDYNRSETFMHGKSRFIEDNDVINTIQTTHSDGIVESVDDRILRDKLCEKVLTSDSTEAYDVVGLNYASRRLDGSKNIVLQKNLSPTLTTSSGDDMAICEPQEESLFTETQKQMFTKDGNIKKFANGDDVEDFNVGDSADLSFPNGSRKGSRVFKQCAPTLCAVSSGKDLVVKVEDEEIPIKNATQKGYLIAKDGDGIDIGGRMHKHRGTVQDGISQTLKTSIDVGVCVKTDKVIELNKDAKHQQDLVQHQDGICRTICCGTHASGPHLLKTAVEEQEDNLKRKLCNHLIEEGLVKEGDIIRHSYTNKRMEDNAIANSDNPDCCSTLDTRADTLGVVVNDDVDLKSDNKKLKSLVDKMDLTKDNQYMDLYNQTTNDDTSGTITTRVDTSNCSAVYSNYRIRKLTPKECWRLMGVKDTDYERVAKNQSNASLYHLAGDSIVTVCLMAIFGKLFNVDYRSKIADLLKELNPNFDFSSIEKEVICEKHSLLNDLLGD